MRFFALLIFAAQLSACRKPTAQDLVGTWQVDYGESTLKLTLKPDSTFEELFQKKGETSVVRRAGRWELTDFEGPSVDLRGALFIDERTGTIDSRLSGYKDGSWVLHINQTFGQLNLTVDEDLGLYFVRGRQE